MKELVRIANCDIEGKKVVYHALRKIKGVSYAFSNAVCEVAKVQKNQQIGTLSDEQVKQIEDTIKNPESVPEFMRNRRKDSSTGKSVHITGTDLKLRTEFDIRHLKKIKSYRGMRHAYGLPVRGQRTKGNFRRGAAVGVQKKKATPATGDKKK